MPNTLIKGVVTIGILTLASIAVLMAIAGQTQVFPGGFIEKTTSAEIRPGFTAAQIADFLPSRGAFTFPAPYNTDAVRITNATDCGGSDCVVPVGYSYWANMNNHVGSDTMLIVLGLTPTRGGTGPTLFSYDKVTEQVTNLGPLFDPSSRFHGSTVEGWYFSASMPDALYMMDGSKVLRYDVLRREFSTVFDAASWLGGGVYVWQIHSSADDEVHIGTIRSSATYQMLGCAAYLESTGQFLYFPASGILDECHLDKSGRWMVMLDNVDFAQGEDNRIIDLQTGTETLLLDQNGAAGHADMGFGYMVAEDNWASLPGAVRRWTLGQTPITSQLVFSATDWRVDAGHITHLNARPGVAPEQQFACNSNATRVQLPRSNEIVCYRLDSSQDVAVVAPVMTNLDASGGGDDYSKRPKGNIDVSGQYFIWTSNMGGPRVDAFVVKIPSHLLTGTGLDVTPPSVSITSPQAGSTLSGSVVLSGTASDDMGVDGVQFQVDGGDLGAEVASPPYLATWDTSGTAPGQHTLTAIARDTAGNETTSSAVMVTVASPTAAPTLSAVTASALTATRATITWITDVPSDSRVQFGTSLPYAYESPLLPSLITSHVVTLSGLNPDTLYHYRIISGDSFGRLSTSMDYTFTTLAPDPSGLVGFWEFSDTDAVARDSTSNHLDGLLMAGAAWSSGWLGQGIQFDGVDDHVLIDADPALNSYPLTIVVSVKTAATGLHGIVNKYFPGAMNGYQLFTNGGNLCAWYFKDATNSVFDGTNCTLAVPGLNDNQWHHVAFVVNASGGALFVDGSLKTTLPWTGTPGPTSSLERLSFGRYPQTAAPYLPGTLDEVRVYARALAPEEVKALFDESLVERRHPRKTGVRLRYVFNKF
jgi:hypothetical protein